MRTSCLTSRTAGGLGTAAQLLLHLCPVRIWPDGPIRSARPGTAAASTSRSSPSTPRRSSSACSTRRRRRGKPRRIALPEQTDQVWHGYLPDVRPGPALRLPRPRAVRAGRRATASTRTRSCSTRTPRRSAARSRWDDAMFGYAIGDPQRRPVVRRPRQRRRARRWPRSSTRPSPGATTGRRERRGTRRSSTSCTSRASRKLHPDVPEPLRGTYPGLASDAGASSTCSDLGRHGRRAAAGPRPRRRPAPGRARA